MDQTCSWMSGQHLLSASPEVLLMDEVSALDVSGAAHEYTKSAELTKVWQGSSL